MTRYRTLPEGTDLTGQVLENLTVVSRVTSDEFRNARYLCHCVCGRTVVKNRHYLMHGVRPRSCGCARTRKPAKNRIDLTGQRFGRLVALRVWKYHPTKGLRWLCQCDCGEKTLVASESLRKGKTRSCGCLRSELSAERSVSRRRDREEREKLVETGA